jgi:peptidoglycan-associated lipoprotein
MLNFAASRWPTFAVLGLALALGACAKNTAQGDGLNGAYGAGGGGGGGPGSYQEFSSSVGDRVFFDTDQTDLSDKARSTLDRQAEWLSRYPRYSFQIEGHADERGTREYNFALGSRRGENVKNYLASKGVSPSRMKMISYGKERPVATCDDISCWSQNRRAVTVLDGAPQS